jgi:hypothetical protein
VRKYWLLDQHGEDGPTALVETDGSMHIVRILRFGPGITELVDQQAIHDRIIGKVAPTMKPLVDGSSIEVAGVEPHADLRGDSKSASTKTNRADRRSAGRAGRAGGRAGGGPSRNGGRGDR